MASNKVIHPAIDGVQIPVTIRGLQKWGLFGYVDYFTFNGTERTIVASTQKQGAEGPRMDAPGRKVDRDNDFLIRPVKHDICVI